MPSIIPIILACLATISFRQETRPKVVNRPTLRLTPGSVSDPSLQPSSITLVLTLRNALQCVSDKQAAPGSLRRLRSVSLQSSSISGASTPTI